MHNINEAVENGDLEKMREFIEKGSDINSATSGGSPFFIACRDNHIRIVKELIKMGVDVNSFPGRGTKPLIVALANNHIALFELLLQHGANPNFTIKQDSKGNSETETKQSSEEHLTPLQLAIIHKKYEIVQLLLNFKANPHVLFRANHTTLQVVVQQENFSLVQALLEQKVDPNIQETINGKTPLHSAVLTNNLEIVKLLLQHKANPNIKTYPHTEKFGVADFTPLFLALYLGVSKKNDTPITDPNTINTKLQIIEELIKNGADVNVTAQHNTTPLIFACKQYFEQGALVLLNNGADPTMPTVHKEYPLHFAALFGLKRVVEKILSIAPHQINVQGYGEGTALHCAIVSEQLEITLLLMKAGANFDIKDKGGKVPFEYFPNKKFPDQIPKFLTGNRK
eukprot:TRINITY_DN3416_c0_g1_i1.p1 TRINITY_DN3416_c0_g1~~TRINITY_DN3416_c0_g1_i1.p1  ORF type:complete len:398 (-),score=104.90 TRINITY_DN3416_c0_g1_i1:39-1232(-)